MKVSQVLRILQADGRRVIATRGSHRRFKHPSEPGRVTVPGKPSDDLAPGTPDSIFKQAGLRHRGRMRYASVIERAAGNRSACVPDLPGCVATGATVEEAEDQVREAIALHPDGLREDGLAASTPASRVEYVEVGA